MIEAFVLSAFAATFAVSFVVLVRRNRRLRADLARLEAAHRLLGTTLAHVEEQSRQNLARLTEALHREQARNRDAGTITPVVHVSRGTSRGVPQPPPSSLRGFRSTEPSRSPPPSPDYDSSLLTSLAVTAALQSSFGSSSYSDSSSSSSSSSDGGSFSSSD